MKSKKIKLGVSINSINAKSAAAKKRKPVTKLKIILANPYKPKNETLSDTEALELEELIQQEIRQSELSDREFARKNKICLGLGSSLRAIKNNKMSCILISQTIKPRFIANQIIYYVREKNSTVPVYIVANLEAMVEKLFGLKSFVVAFSPVLTGGLSKWVANRSTARKKTLGTTVSNESTNTNRKEEEKIDLNLIFLQKETGANRAYVPETVVKSQKPFTQTEAMDWTGDFISFSKGSQQRQKNEGAFEKYKHKVLSALQKMASNIQEDNIKDVSRDTKYISLKGHKIQPNPQRKSELKESKNKS